MLFALLAAVVAVVLAVPPSSDAIYRRVAREMADPMELAAFVKLVTVETPSRAIPADRLPQP